MKQIYFLTLITSAVFTFHCNAQCTGPTLTTVSGPATAICGGSTASLSAVTTGAQVVWFNAATAGTQMGTGNPYVTTPLYTNASYWGEAQTRTVMPAAFGAKPTKTSSGASPGVAATSPWGLSFTATQEFVLNSVDVFLTSTTPGTITIELKDANYVLLETVTVEAPAGGTGANPVQFTVPINLTITPGTYRLVAPFGGPSMNRDLGTNAFPYALGTVGSITGGTINSSPTGNAGVYYFFYNWNFSPVEICKSARKEVAVAVNYAALPGGNGSQTFTTGQTLANLAITGQGLTWYSNAAATIVLPDTTPLTDDTTYYVAQVIDGCRGAVKTVVVDNVMATGQYTFTNLMAYPNPVRDKFTISNTAPIESVTIYNLQGQKVLDKTFNSAIAETDLSALASGHYLVAITAGGAVKNMKITKQ